MTGRTPDSQLRKIHDLMSEVQNLFFKRSGPASENLLEVRLRADTFSKGLRDRQDSAQAALAAGAISHIRSQADSQAIFLVLEKEGHRWVGEKDPIATWGATKATVELKTFIDGMFAAIVVHGEMVDPKKWMFEAVALGTDESPVFLREVKAPQPVGANIPLETSPLFCLNAPLRIGLYVSDGSSVIGCLVFVIAESLLDE